MYPSVVFSKQKSDPNKRKNLHKNHDDCPGSGKLPLQCKAMENRHVRQLPREKFYNVSYNNLP